MIHFFGLVPRLKNISAQTFHDHWRHPHGTMSRLVPGPRSYVQSHQIYTDLLMPDQVQFDGIAELTFDTVKDAMKLGDEPQYKNYVQPDEPNFIDVPRLEWLYTEEELLLPGGHMMENAAYADSQWTPLTLPVSIKLFQFIRSDGNPFWADSDDLELGHRIGALHHVRNHPSREIHGATPPYLGVRQLWWPTLSAFEAGVRKDCEAFQKLISKAGKGVTLLAQAERLLG